MAITLDIKLKRANKIYHEDEIVSGIILLKCNSDVKHDGIFLTMEGSVNLQLSSKNVGIFEAFYNSVKPIQLVQYTLDVAPSGKIPGGKTEIPFELPLKPRGNKPLYETYHGVFVSVQYFVRCDIKRSFLAKDVNKSLEFILEDKETTTTTTGTKLSQHQQQKSHTKIIFYKITPESLQNVRERTGIPKFLISGRLDSVFCKLSQPLTGEVIIEHCEVPIKSIELQLVRVETCGCAEGYSRDATEIQNIQIGEGNVCTGLAIPIHMIFPRLFTCPTLNTSNFKVEFEVNLIVVFEDDYLVTENFPITLTRH